MNRAAIMRLIVCPGDKRSRNSTGTNEIRTIVMVLGRLKSFLFSGERGKESKYL